MSTKPRILVVGGASGGIGSNIADRIEGLWLGQVTMPNQLVDDYSELNVLTSPSVDEFLRKTRKTPFTHLVYTAARNLPEPIMETSIPRMTLDYQMNVAGFVNLCASMRRIQEDTLRSAVAISSDARKIPMRGSVSYCATKAALSQAVAVMGREWAGEVRVNAVAPTSIEGTPMTRRVNKEFAASRGMTPQEALKYEMQSLPMGRKVSGDEVAHLVVDVLFGPDYMTGTTVDITGGKL